MGPILHPSFALLASVTRQDLARQVAYLKEENRILRARLPKRIVTTPRERTRLLKVDHRLLTQLRELIVDRQQDCLPHSTAARPAASSNRCNRSCHASQASSAQRFRRGNSGTRNSSSIP